MKPSVYADDIIPRVFLFMGEEAQLLNRLCLRMVRVIFISPFSPIKYNIGTKLTVSYVFMFAHMSDV